MIKQFFKKVLISYLIIICCIFTPTYNAYAVSPAGWSMKAFNIPSNILTAVKNGVSVSVSAAPSAATVGSYAIRFAGAAAIAYAVSKYGGDAIDWILDPANNQVRKKDVPYVPNCGYSHVFSSITSPDPNAVCQAIAKNRGQTFLYFDTKTEYCQMKGDNWKLQSTSCGAAGAVVTAYELGNNFLNKARVGDSAAASVVNGAMGEDVNRGTYDTALDKAAAQKAADNATHNCGSGTTWNGSACVADTTTTPDTPTNDTPFDPTSIIDAINSVFNAIKNLFDAVVSIPQVINDAIDKVLSAIASIIDVINAAIDKVINAITDIIKPLVDLLTSFINWVKEKFTALYDAITDFFDWVKTTYDDFVKPADNEPTQLDIPNNLPTPTDTNIRFGGMCPPNAEINVRIPFATINATLFDWSKWCYNLDTFVKPVIILLAAYFSVLIFRGKNESS